MILVRVTKIIVRSHGRLVVGSTQSLRENINQRCASKVQLLAEKRNLYGTEIVLTENRTGK